MCNISNIAKVPAGVLGGLGLVLSTVENFRHLNLILEESFWPILIVSFVLSIGAAWPKSEARRVLGPKETYKPNAKRVVLRYKWIFLLIVVFLAVGYYRYHLINAKQAGERPVIKPGDIPLEPGASLLILSSVYSQARTKEPRLVQFALRPEKTLFIERPNPFPKLYERYADKPIKFYQLDGRLAGAIDSGRCNDEFKAGEALRALRAYARYSEKLSLLKYIETETQLNSLIVSHPDIAKALVPAPGEWGNLSRADYFAILNWVRNCVGIFFPVFTVSIENPTNQDLLIREIKYNIIKKLEIYHSSPPPPEPLIPTASYVHKLDHKEGIQPYSVIPPFRIPANSSGAFELQLYTDDGPEVGFEMVIEFVTNQTTIKTDHFLLVMFERER
jgi:hypothetical protein